VNFPFTIEKRIVLDRNEFPISSDGYVINHIEEYMDKYGMHKTRVGINELFYMNIDLTRSSARRKIIQSLSFKVSVTESDIVVTIETSMIFVSLFSLIVLAASPFLLPFPIVLAPLLVAIGFFSVIYLVQLSLLTTIKSEVLEVLCAL